MPNAANFRLLPHEISISRGDKYSVTPLHYAVKSKNKESVKILLQNGADVCATAYKNKSVPHYLFEKNEEDSLGQEEDCVDIMKMLMAKGAPIDVVDSDGKTLLHHAAANKQKEVIKLLLPHYQSEFLEKIDVWSNFALHLLLENIKVVDKSEEVKYLEVVKLMIEKTPSMIQHYDRFGRTLLHLTAQYGQTEILKMILPCYKNK
ncbi:hypothetical protein QAD02_019903 [Eretmocerus hayati]|uniref:Uncharacterized protein n=1 Tax=Eretmocerus hayati TaxID=131215 RepID=A0ACC2PKX3_9HYME|nr:hypothetical protein QAD02_019903 [Eretmocerus hayati]